MIAKQAAAVAAALTGLLLTVPFLQANEPGPQLLITNVRIFDGVAEKLQPGSVLVEGNLIKAVGTEVAASPDASVIDGGGRVLSPGFVDAHTHMSLIAPFEQLENEYTGIYVGAAAGQMAEAMAHAKAVVDLCRLAGQPQC